MSSNICETCSKPSSVLIECRDDDGVYCIECAQNHETHCLRYVVRCNDCHSNISTFICQTCSNHSDYHVCSECQVKLHPTQRQLRKRSIKKDHYIKSNDDEGHCLKKRSFGTRTSRHEMYDGLYCIRAKLPLRQESRRSEATKESDEHLVRIKERIAKMLRLAGNPGTGEEGAHASRVAAEWMSKYQLSKYDLAIKGEMEGGDYKVYLFSTAPNQDRARRSFVSASQTWLQNLTIRVQSVFPHFIETYTSTYSLWAIPYKAFLGVEDAAYSACELFRDLLDIVCKYTKIMVLSGRFKSFMAIESYAIGMVDGLNVKTFAQIPELMKDMTEDDKNKMTVISDAGKTIIQEMRSRHNFRGLKTKSNKMDWDAYAKGKKDAETAHDRASKQLRIQC